MIRFWYILFFISAYNPVLSQEKYKLPKELNEISGLEKLNDSVLIAINDSGNSPDILFINLKGKILRKCHVINAPNNDWEDLTMDDKGNLYIADVGNNLNNRKDLCVLKLNAEVAFHLDSIEVKKIFFSYIDQTQFPPKATASKFNCEAIYWMNDTLHLITKNESKKSENPNWNRFPEDYVLSDKPGNYSVYQNTQPIEYLKKVNKRGIEDLVTSIDFYNGILAVLTYSQIRTFRLNDSDSNSNDLKDWGTKKFKKIAQREALVIFSDKTIYIATEKYPILGGPFLYKKTFE